ncbi:hypothetical protein Csa_008295, partial [Cucumis sativus]
ENFGKRSSNAASRKVYYRRQDMSCLENLTLDMTYLNVASTPFLMRPTSTSRIHLLVQFSQHVPQRTLLRRKTFFRRTL